MAGEKDLRRIVAELPEVEEIPSDGFDFRVGGKGFMTASSSASFSRRP